MKAQGRHIVVLSWFVVETGNWSRTVWSGLEQRMQEASDGVGNSDKSRWSWVFKRVITPSPLALGHEDLGVIRPTP